MQLAAFAFDYDGTLAKDGCVAPSTVHALGRLKAAGPRLLLVSGRELRGRAQSACTESDPVPATR